MSIQRCSQVIMESFSSYCGAMILTIYFLCFVFLPYCVFVPLFYLPCSVCLYYCTNICCQPVRHFTSLIVVGVTVGFTVRVTVGVTVTVSIVFLRTSLRPRYLLYLYSESYCIVLHRDFYLITRLMHYCIFSTVCILCLMIIDVFFQYFAILARHSIT